MKRAICQAVSTHIKFPCGLAVDWKVMTEHM